MSFYGPNEPALGNDTCAGLTKYEYAVLKLAAAYIASGTCGESAIDYAIQTADDLFGLNQEDTCNG